MMQCINMKLKLLIERDKIVNSRKGGSMGNTRCTLCKQIYDDEKNMHYIRFNNVYYYASREVF
jgi:hypothetical protein